jgi:RHH-type transcriptional regulator, rel operon repressor / antitoxin RelB
MTEEAVLMSISIRMNDKEMKLVKKYAELNGTTISDVMRKAILEKIEDEFDIFLYDQAYKAYEQDSKTYTIGEAKSLLGIK